MTLINQHAQTKFLRGFWREGGTCILSTHNMGELQLSGKSTNYWSLQCLEGIYATTVSVTPDPSSYRLTAAVMAHTLEKTTDHSNYTTAGKHNIPYHHFLRLTGWQRSDPEANDISLSKQRSPEQDPSSVLAPPPHLHAITFYTITSIATPLDHLSPYW